MLTQHALSTNVIDVHTGASTANSTTYYTASHFGQGAYEGQVLYAYGKYVDDLVKLGHEVWRIQNRTLLYMGPYVKRCVEPWFETSTDYTYYLGISAISASS